jgi:hypothetical protein
MSLFTCRKKYGKNKISHGMMKNKKHMTVGGEKGNEKLSERREKINKS